MDWRAKIDIYCERVGPEFWAEPLNAVTNAAFVAAALAALVTARRAGRLTPTRAALIGLAAAVGVGSFLFHTVAERWAGAADVIPILLFIVAYLFAALRDFFTLPAWAAGLGALAFIPAARGFQAYVGPYMPEFLDAALGYLPAFLALAVSAGLLGLRAHPAARGLGLAAALFALSLAFRSLDAPLCAAWPWGTHFLWHVLNGAVLGVLMRAHLRCARPLAPPLAAR